MCGIAGILNTRPGDRRLSAIYRMTRAMRHRGPDDEGVAFFERQGDRWSVSAGKDTPEAVLRDKAAGYLPGQRNVEPPDDSAMLALGHRRLAILDLTATGHNPMCTEDGRYWIVHNGEVYNFRELRRELEAGGDRFISRTDTEVILKAYRRWGADCLQRFNGMWAFAIWDNATKELFCARDRVGIKPFFFWTSRDGFVFASEIRAIIASGLYQPQVDATGVWHAISLQTAPRPRTCFTGVASLEPAHWLRVSARGEMHKERYWQIPLTEVDERPTEGEWKEALADQLRAAVRRRLVADVPVGIQLSGGVDSNTVTALAAREHPGIHAFTLAFTGDDAGKDESQSARDTAKMYPVHHVVKPVDPLQMWESVDAMVRCHEEPWYPISAPHEVLALTREHDVTVSLCGLGGDELFCGYPRWQDLAQWARLHHPLNWPTLQWRRLTEQWGRARQPRNRVPLSGLPNYAAAYVDTFARLTEAEKQGLFEPEFHAAPTDADFAARYPGPECGFADPIQAACYYELVHYVGNHHVYRQDQISMRFSLESRFPLLDHELIEFAFRVPSRFKVRRGTGKYLLREAARKWIAPSCLDLEKRGFSLPWSRWLRGPLRDAVVDSLETLQARPMMRRQRIARLIERVAAGQGRTMMIWRLVGLELWFRAFFDPRTRTDSPFAPLRAAAP